MNTNWKIIQMMQSNFNFRLLSENGSYCTRESSIPYSRQNLIGRAWIVLKIDKQLKDRELNESVTLVKSLINEK